MTTDNNKPRTSSCLPYNDGLLITAQILSFIAIVLSWTNIITFVLGIVAFICLQVVWCCRMKKCGLITVGVLTLIASIVDLIIGIYIFVEGSKTICDNNKNFMDTVFDQNDNDNENYNENTNAEAEANAIISINGTGRFYDDGDDFILNMSQEDINNMNNMNNGIDKYCDPTVNAWGGIALAAGTLWLIITFLIFYFTCGNRIERFNNNNNNNNNNNRQKVFFTAEEEAQCDRGRGECVIPRATDKGVNIVMDDNEREHERRQTNQNRSVTGVVTGDADNV